MHKKTRKGEMMQKLARNHSLEAKREILYGVALEMRRPVFIEAVGSPSGRLINIVRMRAASETYGQVTRVRTSNPTVRPSKPRMSGRTGVLSGRLSYTRPDAKRGRPNASHWKMQKTEEKFAKINFPKVSCRIHMYNQLITQSNSFSKLSRDTREGSNFNQHKDFPVDRKFKWTTQLMQCVCVCVKTFPIRYDFHWYDKEQPDFLNKRENQWKISQKLNLITYYCLATLI